MNKMSKALFGLLLTVSALPAFAQETEMRPYASVMYDTVFSDQHRDSQTGNGYSVGLGKALNKYWGLELGGFYDKAKPDGAAGHEWREYGGKLDGLFFFSRNPSFSPYTAVGLGGMENNRRDTNDKSFNFTADAGAGFFKYFPVGSYDIGFRVDLRYRWVDAKDLPAVGTDGHHIFGEPVLKVGLVFPFGKRASADTVAVAAPVATATTEAPAKVGDQSAGDSTRSFEDVHFDFDRADLTDRSKAILDNAAGAINGLTQKYPGMKVDLSGHTDWIGTEGYNQALSERRADNVKQYLTKKGVAANRLTTHAYGETKPVASNDTEEGRARNRRVEIKTDVPKN